MDTKYSVCSIAAAAGNSDRASAAKNSLGIFLPLRGGRAAVLGAVQRGAAVLEPTPDTTSIWHTAEKKKKTAGRE